jgi:MFS family permease
MQIPAAFKHRQFAIFWVGLIFAWMGRQMFTWGLPWHIRTFTENPLALGAIGLIRLIPTIFLSLFAGVIADRFNRRYIVFVTQSAMGLVALTLALLTLTKTIQLWHIYGLLAIQATLYVFDLPARLSLTPNLVSKQNLSNAISVEFMAIQIGSLIGPILSGGLIEYYGQSAAYFGTVILFVIMLLALLAIGPVAQQKMEIAPTGIDWVAIRTGIRFTFKHPLIFPSMLLDFLATLLTRADSLMPYFARDILGLNAVQYGWLSAASAIGANLAGVTLAFTQKIRNQGRLLLTAVGMIGVAAVVFGFSRSFPLSMAALMLAGASDSISSIIRSAIRQLHTPDDLRGRMTSVNQIFFSGGPYAGDVKAGFLGGLIGVPLAVGLGGIACVLAVAGINWQWPQLRAYDGAIPIEEI